MSHKSALSSFALGLWCLTSAAAFAATPLESLATRTGDGPGNSGDAVYRDDGTLELSDLHLSAVTKEPNLEFLQAIPDLMAFILEIGQVSPELALEIWMDLRGLKIFTTPDLLRLPAPQGTKITRLNPEAQFARRFGSILIISTPSLEQASHPSHVFVHEALHGLNSDKGEIHQFFVEQATAYLVNSRGKYERDALLQKMEDLEISFRDASKLWGWEKNAKWRPDAIRKLAWLFKDEGEMHFQCGVFGQMLENEGYMRNGEQKNALRQALVELRPLLNECKPELLAVLRDGYLPLIAKEAELAAPLRLHLDNVNVDPIYYHLGRSKKERHKKILAQCEKVSFEGVRAFLETVNFATPLVLKEVLEARRRALNASDPAERVYLLQGVLSFPEAFYWVRLGSSEEEIGKNVAERFEVMRARLKDLLGRCEEVLAELGYDPFGRRLGDGLAVQKTGRKKKR